MSEWRTFISEFRAPKSDVAVLADDVPARRCSWDLTVAIEVGMVLAAFLFMRRMAEVTNISVLTHEFTDPVDDFEHDPNAVRDAPFPMACRSTRSPGPFFFGAAEMFKDRVGRIAGKPKVLIIRMRHVPAIDLDGLARAARADSPQPPGRDAGDSIRTCTRSRSWRSSVPGLYDELGEENIHGNIDDALNRAREYLGLPPTAPPQGRRRLSRRESKDSLTMRFMKPGTGVGLTSAHLYRSRLMRPRLIVARSGCCHRPPRVSRAVAAADAACSRAADQRSGRRLHGEAPIGSAASPRGHRSGRAGALHQPAPPPADLDPAREDRDRRRRDV